MYFTVPLAGAVILAEGLLKIGTSLLDFNNHRRPGCASWLRHTATTSC
jgi:hypothetical protein